MITRFSRLHFARCFKPVPSNLQSRIWISSSASRYLASTFSYDLVDSYIFVIDVGAGDDIPRKNGPGFMQADLVVINKIDLAPYVGADLEVIRRDAAERRPDKPVLYTNCKTGEGLEAVVNFIRQTVLFRSHQPELVLSP